MSNVLNLKGVKLFAIIVLAVAILATFGMVAVQQASADCTITMTLRVGSSGTEVQCLQGKVGATADGAFGPLTLASVKAYQASHGLVADGVVGPLTRAVLNGSVSGMFPAGCTSASGYSTVTGMACNSLPANTFAPAGCTSSSGYSPVTGGACYAVSASLPAGCTSTAGYSPTTGASCSGGSSPSNSGPLSGGAGSANYSLMSDFSSEIVGEDEEDVEVAGLEVEADGSDIELTAVRLVFTQGSAGSDFDNYASEVSVWLDGEEIGRVDADQFDDNNSYTSTITLDGGVIREDDTGELVVAVSGVNNLDTADAGDTWTVDFRSVRYVDAQGDSTSEDPSTATKTFSFESFATSSETELKLELTDDASGDAINKAHLINDHATDENKLKSIPLLEFTLEAEGGSDLKIRDFGIDIVVATEDNVDELIAGGTSPEIFLEIEGQRYGTAGYNEDSDDTDVGVDEEVKFTDVNYTIDAGDTVTVRILANFNAIDATDRAATATIYAQITETQTDDTALFDVRDESGTQIVDADITGSPTGVASTLRDFGFDLTFVSGTASRSHTGDVANTLDHDEGTFVLVFEVSAWADNEDTTTAAIFIDESAPHETGTTASLVTVVGTDVYVTSSLTRTGGDSSTHSADTFRVDAGDTVEFTITFVTAAGADGLFDITLADLQYALTDIDGNLSVMDAQIEMTDDFQTKPPLSLNFDA